MWASKVDGLPIEPTCGYQYQGSPAFWLVLGCLLGTGAWWLASTSARQQRQRHQQLHAATVIEWDESSLQRLFREHMPLWLADPQMVRQPEWLNAMVKAMWPHFSVAAERLATRGQQLEELLNSSSVWRPRWMGGSRVAVQGVYLGQTPPRVTAIKAVTRQDGSSASSNQLSLDCSFVWSSELEVKLLFYLFFREGEENRSRGRILRFLRRLVPQAMFIKIGVREVVVSGNMRITLAPLLEQLPLVGAARISLLGPPDFAYQTSVFGGNPFVMPGVEAWINSFIRTSVLSPFLYPSGFDVALPGAPDTGAARQEPEGLLEVQVIEAVSIPRMDYFWGKADPYVKLWVRDESKFQTSVKSWTLNPTWDEQFTLIVHSSHFQVLTLAIYDSDALLPDEEIGRAMVPLSTLDSRPGASSDLWVPIVRSYAAPRKRSSRQQPSVRQHGAGASVLRSSDGSRSPGGEVAAREDTARGVLGLFRRRRSTELLSGAMQPGLQRTTGFDRLAALVPGMPAAANAGCQLHIRVGYAPFSRQEVEAAMAANRPGIVSILRRLSRASMVPELLRSGVLSIKLEKAEGLARKRKAGFTRNYKVKVTVGKSVKVTERGKVAFQHKSDPLFDERLEIIVDGDTASSETSQIELEVWAAHFIRRPTFKGRAIVPLRDVQRKRRLRGSWPLQDADGGVLVAEFVWRSAAGMCK